MEREKPTFSKNLFWDVDINDVDIDKYPAFVIERVLVYGQLEDWRKIRSYLGLDSIKKIAVNIRSLDPRSLSFVSTMTHTPIEEFRCYKLSQSNQQPWFF